MNTTETSIHLPGHTSEGGATPSICWSDWFRFDEEQQKCVFRTTSSLAEANTIVEALKSVQEAQA